MDCNQLDTVIEGLADGTCEPSPAERAHLDTCAACQASLEHARQLERFLIGRDSPLPSAAFTAGVMALISRERWQTERVFDLGFNLAVAAGLIFVAIGAAGLAWSLGFLTVTIDFRACLDFAGREMGDAVLSQVQTIVMAAALLTMALGLWWWAEADSPLS